ncbi:carboxypeptidase regulatory-like domain-containing protein [Hymenobacter coalescens]
MGGTITDKAGEGLPGATVIAIHTPTNTQYVAPTNSEGRYNIQNMRVGGPYTVRITFVGYQEVTREGLFLTLGQTQRLDINLSEATTQLQGVEIAGRRDPVINAGRTGAETSVSGEQIQRLPTLNRNLQDFIRVSPQANGGGSSSIGGSNNRYNNITIDGAVNNDVFGLSGSGTPGGNAGNQPISLDAVQELQIVVAPYDVTLGNFTGGGVNAVTRSGTNDLSASIYGFGRNQNSIGKSVTEPRTKASDFYNYQTGARVGGAIVKDKVFFFLNGEISRRNEPLAFVPGTSASRIDQSVLTQIANRAASRYNYDVGGTELNRRTESNKLFGRLDFNLSQNHQLTLRHNFVEGFDDNISRNSTQIRFGNNNFQNNNTTNSSVAELNSRLGNFSNKLLVSYTRIRDNRTTDGALFPTFEINQSGNRYTFGTERSSGFNELDQDIVEFTDNVTRAVGKHTFTLGTHNEFFKFRNLFINNGVGYYQFNSLDDFLNERPNRLQAAYATNNNGEATFSAMQAGVYAQDEYSPRENLRLTLGVRLDVPFFFDEPGLNQGVTDRFGSNISTQNTPNGQLLWAPRLGFNWDVNNDSRVQVRGGTGVFTGRVPFVWISNGFTNSGLIQGAVDARPVTTGTPPNQTTTYPAIVTDPALIRTTFNAVPTAEINVIDKNFKLPQVWRTNLAVDFRLPGDIVATVEGIYSKTLNDIYYKNINLVAPTGRLAGPDQRPVYPSARQIDTRYTNVLQLDNTNKGYRYNATVQLQKQFTSGLNTSLAYTYGMSKEVNSGASSTALSNWQFNQVQSDPNNPELGFSRNDQRHRVLATGGYTLRYAGDKLATNFSVIYEGLSGAPIAYVYGAGGRDLNNDGGFANDLIYIPRNANDPNEIGIVRTPTPPGGTPDPRTVEEIRAQLEAFISNDPYLNSRRGQYAERFAARTPWMHQVDVRVAQDFNFTAGGKKNTIQVSFDIQNVGNLLNNEWGRQYFVQNNAVELLRPETTGVNVRPTFSFPATFAANGNRGYDISAFASRWQGQLGVRYIFN